MNSETCERAYRRRLAGSCQLRTGAGRLIRSAESVEAIEPDLIGRRELWLCYVNFGRVNYGRPVWVRRRAPGGGDL